MEKGKTPEEIMKNLEGLPLADVFIIAKEICHHNKEFKKFWYSY